MTQYLISFGAHAMDHVPEEEWPAVGKAAHASRDHPLSVPPLDRGFSHSLEQTQQAKEPF
jgi:hypothetical protein